VTRRIVQPDGECHISKQKVVIGPQPKLNPLDGNGNRKTCHGCGSTEHFLFQCPDASQERKINFYEQLELHAAREGAPQIAASVQGVSAPSNISLVYEEEIPELLEVTCRPFEDVSGKAATAVSFCDSGYLGVCIDTGAESSVAGSKQFAAYLRSTSVPCRGNVATTKRPSKRFRFGTQIFESNHLATVRFPVTPVLDDSPAFFEFTVHVVELDCPILLGLDTLLAHGIQADTKQMQLKTESWVAPLVLNRGHLFVSSCTGSVLFTESELNKLHTSLAHPSADKLLDLLKRARPSEVSADTAIALKRIGKSCRICTMYGPPPRRVRSSVPEEIVFNHHLVMDIFYLGGDPCLHIICKGTRYNVTSFLTSKHAENI
jgi:hypothetical protein